MIQVIDEHHLRVGDRTWFGEFNSDHSVTAEEAAVLSERLGYEFAFERRQFIVRFESKWSVSVIWGSMTYSDNHDHGFGFPPYQAFIETPTLVEAGILHADRERLQPDGDPYAYIDAEQLNALLEMVSVLPTEAHIEWTGEWQR